MEKFKSASNEADHYNKEIKSELKFSKTLSDHIAVLITNIFGSMQFLCACFIVFFVWILWNLKVIPFLKPFDPYPFVLLTMVVSLFAIILSVSVLISQNRQGKMDSIRQKIEFEVNVRAENEITKVLEMLHGIEKKLGVDRTSDSELEAMKETLNIQELHEKLIDIDQGTK